MRNLKKKIVWGLLIMVIVFGLIPLVGINRITDDNNSYNLVMKGLAKSNNKNLIKEVYNDNVTTTTVTEVGDDDLSPQPPAAAPVVRFAYLYNSWELKKKKIMKAEGLKGEAEEIMSSTIPKGMRSVKQLFSGRLTVGIYSMYMTFIISFYGIAVKIATYRQVSQDILVRHTVAFLLVWLVNMLIGVWVLVVNDGQLLSTVWYSVLEFIFYLTLSAAPLIIVHCFSTNFCTWEGVRARLGIVRESGAERARQYLIQQLQRIAVNFTEGLDEDNLC